MSDSSFAVAPQAAAHQVTISRFVSLAVRGLVPMFDVQRNLFCYKLKLTDQGMVQEGLSERYTMMTLMGLHRLRQSGATSPFDTDKIIETLFADLRWVDNVGDLGVLLWFCGIVCPERYAELERKIDISNALTRYRDVRLGITMDLSWFLTGVSYWAELFPQKSPRLEPLALATYETLTKNQGERGFFGHLSTSRSLAGVVRGRIGSFADQVYPIYAMSQFGKAYRHEEAIQCAQKCGAGICEEQGPKGQWWWHYDAHAGRVADGYPVFSVHQHAMGPMTLFKLAEVVDSNFDGWIHKGLTWINSNNELNVEMEDPSRDIIWRCIFRSRRSVTRYLRTAFGAYSNTVEEDNAADLKVLYECRPYELGWLLYAFANRQTASLRTPAESSRNTTESARRARKNI
jgi:hypothetical protein